MSKKARPNDTYLDFYNQAVEERQKDKRSGFEVLKEKVSRCKRFLKTGKPKGAIMDIEKLARIVDLSLGRSESIVFRALMGLPEAKEGDREAARSFAPRERKNLFLGACSEIFEQLDFELGVE